MHFCCVTCVVNYNLITAACMLACCWLPRGLLLSLDEQNVDAVLLHRPPTPHPIEQPHRAAMGRDIAPSLFVIKMSHIFIRAILTWHVKRVSTRTTLTLALSATSWCDSSVAPLQLLYAHLPLIHSATDQQAPIQRQRNACM